MGASQTWKSIDVCWDIADIPSTFSHPLDFRNAVLELIEQALEDANAGAWGAAEIGANPKTGIPEVNVVYDVDDFAQAEAIVRKTVQGTPFDCIREILRYEGQIEEGGPPE